MAVPLITFVRSREIYRGRNAAKALGFGLKRLLNSDLLVHRE
jgi:hypothetical protein